MVQNQIAGDPAERHPVFFSMLPFANHFPNSAGNDETDISHVDGDSYDRTDAVFAGRMSEFQVRDAGKPREALSNYISNRGSKFQRHGDVFFVCSPPGFFLRKAKSVFVANFPNIIILQELNFALRALATDVTLLLKKKILLAELTAQPVPAQRNPMTNPNAHPNASDDLDRFAVDIFESLAGRFPVCLSSDEFHYFPHFKSDRHDWTRWDDFSSDAVSDTVEQLFSWESTLESFLKRDLPAPDRIDILMLGRILSTLREQLQEVRLHETQPTFHLTLAAIGLAEALEAKDDLDAFSSRVRSFPRWVDTVIATLGRMPRLYRDMGLEMIEKLKHWVLSLKIADVSLSPAAAALERLKDHLEAMPVNDDFRLKKEHYARIADRHMGCSMGLKAIKESLEAEIQETRAILGKEAERLHPGRPWQAVLANLSVPGGSEKGSRAHYQSVIADLRAHCVHRGFAPRRLTENSSVHIEEIPDYLLPVRSGAAFSMAPGHPARDGTFFILPDTQSGGLPPDYRLLAAHETFPGHHLLDASRWSLERTLRRPIEFPLFYEGWASFSEEILFDTGFFSGPADRLLMAKRRFWRAMRGRTDLEIHTGVRGLEEAVSELVREGLEKEKAVAMVKRYALKPGYQLAYTIGRRWFRRIYDDYIGNGGTPEGFVRKVMVEGEIDLDHLSGLLAERPVEKQKIEGGRT